MNIGYACQLIGTGPVQIKSCILKNATPEKLAELSAHNLDVLDHMLDYNIANHIPLFRISSDIIPFGSNPAAQFPWSDIFADRLKALGDKAQNHGIRLSMHPGQYTVLNSPTPGTVLGAVEDLRYHTRFLDAMGLGAEHKVILHIGGGYGDKAAAAQRFIRNCGELDQAVRSRLILENDDRIYNIEEVVDIASACGLPVVMDVFHHQVNPCPGDSSLESWLMESRNTWTARDGGQKIHYSQQAEGKKPGSHSDTISVDAFLEFYRGLPAEMDIMLEVKDKNLSAVKCRFCTQDKLHVKHLEAEWGRYKYAVLEHDPRGYREIRELLKDKSGPIAPPFYRLIEQALAHPVSPGNAVNAAQHVWGYFKNHASAREKEQFGKLLESLNQGGPAAKGMKKLLWKLSVNYNQPYLLQSYYFIFPH